MRWGVKPLLPVLCTIVTAHSITPLLAAQRVVRDCNRGNHILKFAIITLDLYFHSNSSSATLCNCPFYSCQPSQGELSHWLYCSKSQVNSSLRTNTWYIRLTQCRLRIKHSAAWLTSLVIRCSFIHDYLCSSRAQCFFMILSFDVEAIQKHYHIQQKCKAVFWSEAGLTCCLPLGVILCACSSLVIEQLWCNQLWQETHLHCASRSTLRKK